jgi:hypothetical protein
VTNVSVRKSMPSFGLFDALSQTDVAVLQETGCRKPGVLSSFSPILQRASGLTGQAVALLLYLLYELIVGVGELLHTLRLQQLYYVVVVHAGLL